jgi:hypothetical protein
VRGQMLVQLAQLEKSIRVRATGGRDVAVRTQSSDHGVSLSLSGAGPGRRHFVNIYSDVIYCAAQAVYDKDGGRCREAVGPADSGRT